MAILQLVHPKRILPSVTLPTSTKISEIVEAVSYLMMREYSEPAPMIDWQQVAREEKENHDAQETMKEYSLYWANKELLQSEPETTLASYIGSNEKTKVVIKIGSVSQPCQLLVHQGIDD
jgi:hypothetical protein